MDNYVKAKIKCIALRCRQLREDRKVSRAEIAMALHRTPNSVAMFEYGTIDNLSYLIAYSDVLQVSMSYLLDFDRRDLWEELKNK